LRLWGLCSLRCSWRHSKHWFVCRGRWWRSNRRNRSRRRNFFSGRLFCCFSVFCVFGQEVLEDADIHICVLGCRVGVNAIVTLENAFTLAKNVSKPTETGIDGFERFKSLNK